MNHRILIIGGGAIGAFYGALLQRNGAKVAMVCRSNHDVVSKSGYFVESSTFGHFQFIPNSVAQSASEYIGAPDFVIVSTKGLKRQNTVDLLRPIVQPGVAIVLLQNGIEIEREIANAFPKNDIISAVAYVTLNQLVPGKVVHTALGHLAIGNYPSGTSENTTKLAALFQESRIRCTATPTIALFRWQKAVWNASVNPLSVLLGGADTTAVLTRAEPLLRLAMNEVSNVAAATGYALAPDIVEFSIDSTRNMTRHVTSMSQDFLRNREMEIEPILGNIVRIARTHNVPVPTLESMYWLLSGLSQ